MCETWTTPLMRHVNFNLSKKKLEGMLMNET